MTKFGRLIALIIFPFLLTSCYGIAHWLYYKQEGARQKKAEQINKNFDEDGWYAYKNSFDSDSLLAYFWKSYPTEMELFSHSKNEGNFFHTYLVPPDTLSNYSWHVPSSKKNYFDPFHPWVSYEAFIRVNNESKRKAVKQGKNRCYFKLDKKYTACCLITKDQIFVPYLIYESPDIIGYPKPYPYGESLHAYKKTLVPIETDNRYTYPNFVEIDTTYQYYTDTSSAFLDFTKNFVQDPVYFSDLKEMDTFSFSSIQITQFQEIHHKKIVNFRRKLFKKIADRSFLGSSVRSHKIESRAYENAIPPEKKMRIKKKLDAYFKKLEKKFEQGKE